MENKLVSQMNDILSQWKETFDYFSQIQLCFTVNSQNILCLNDISLGPTPVANLDRVMFNPEQIEFFFTDSSQLQIIISWPEDSTPFVAYTAIAPA